MAVGNPYGRHAYGKGPYARATGRPYGVGPYGTGYYSRFQSNTFDMAGSAALHWNVTAQAQHQIGLWAVTSVTFSAGGAPSVNMYPEAIATIAFSVWARGLVSWLGPPPCETGTWQPAELCEAGGWSAPPGCGPGTWTPTRLT